MNDVKHRHNGAATLDSSKHESTCTLKGKQSYWMKAYIKKLVIQIFAAIKRSQSETMLKSVANSAR